MKRIVLIVIVAGVLSGCAKWRTGSVCIEPFTTTGVKTSNPIDVKQDSIDYIRNQIPDVFKKQIEAETKLIVETDCTKADYVVSGRVGNIETALQGSSKYSERTIGIGIQGVVKNNKTSEILSKFDEFQHYGTLDNTLWALSRKVIYGAQYVSSP